MAEGRLYCPKCNLLVSIGATASPLTTCPKCQGMMVAVVKSAGVPGLKPSASYDASGILKAAALVEGEIVAGSDAYSAPDNRPPAKPEPKDSPFLLVDAKCPVCGILTEQRYFKSSVFYTPSTDIDIKPLSYVWQRPEFQTCYPPFYYIWFCPKCSFAGNQGAFERISSNTDIPDRQVVQAVLDASKSPDNAELLEMLSEGIDFESVDFIMAMKLYLLAIRQMECVRAVAERDSIPLGQYYLRLSWIYRDFVTSNPAEASDPVGFKKLMFKYKYLGMRIRKVWPSAPLDEDAAQAGSHKYYNQAYNLSPVVNTKGIDFNILDILCRIEIKRREFNSARLSMAKAFQTGQSRREAIQKEIRAQASDDSTRGKERLIELKKEMRKAEYFINDMRNLSAQIPGFDAGSL